MNEKGDVLFLGVVNRQTPKPRWHRGNGLEVITCEGGDAGGWDGGQRLSLAKTVSTLVGERSVLLVHVAPRSVAGRQPNAGGWLARLHRFREAKREERIGGERGLVGS